MRKTCLNHSCSVREQEKAGTRSCQLIASKADTRRSDRRTGSLQVLRCHCCDCELLPDLKSLNHFLSVSGSREAVPSRLEMLGDRSISSEELLGRSGGLKPPHATDDTRVSGKEEATISITGNLHCQSCYRAIDATVAVQSWIRSLGCRTSSNPRRPALKNTRSNLRTCSSISVRSFLRCPSGLIPPATYPVIRSASVTSAISARLAPPAAATALRSRLWCTGSIVTINSRLSSCTIRVLRRFLEMNIPL
jgi:hypothetical protein